MAGTHSGLAHEEGTRLDTGISGEEIVVQPYHKGFPPDAVGCRVEGLRGKLSIFDGLTTPVLLLRSDELDHNIRTFQAYCDDRSVSLAPHVKTSMSPQIMRRQLAAGAWAVTVANYRQSITAADAGAHRILIANEIVGEADIAALGAAVDRGRTPEYFCYADSAAGIRIMDESLSRRGQQDPLSVLIEVGLPGGRGGVRTVDDAVRLAEQVHEAQYLSLGGVSGFEGIMDIGFDPDRLGEVRDYLEDLRAAADAVFATWEPTSSEFVVSAGGSVFFDAVIEELGAVWRRSRPIRVVVRSGCYVAHDSGPLDEYLRVLPTAVDTVDLRPALQLWSRVISRPEPRLAILDFGRRDTSNDAGYPVVNSMVRRGGTAVEPGPSAEITRLNDQHAYLRLDLCAEEAPARLLPEVGDLIGLGIAHPCTTLDKWRVIPVVDSSLTLVGACATEF